MGRPYILMNAAVSVDGKIAPASRATVRLGGSRDQERMDLLRAGSDAVLIGAGTLRADNPPLQVRRPALRRRRVRNGLSPWLLEVIISRSLSLPVRTGSAGPAPPPRVIVAPASAPHRRLASLRRSCEVMIVGEEKVEPGALLDRLGSRGVRRLLVEGGGDTFAIFLAEGLVDEIHLTVCPWLIGGRRAPTLFDGEGLAAENMTRLALDLCRREGEEIYLRYRRRPARRAGRPARRARG